MNQVATQLAPPFCILFYLSFKEEKLKETRACRAGWLAGFTDERNIRTDGRHRSISQENNLLRYLPRPNF